MLIVCLTQSWLASFLLLLVGDLIYHIMGPLLTSFTLSLRDRLKLNDQGKQSSLLEWPLRSVTLCSHKVCKGFNSGHGSIYGFSCLPFLTAVLKSDYEDNRFNCVFYGKPSIFRVQVLIVVTHMSWVYKVPKMSIFPIIFVDCSITPSRATNLKNLNTKQMWK